MEVLEFREEGIYCPAGEFYIDPVRPVNKAVITHAHSDHAKAGMKSYLCHSRSKETLRLRLGQNISVEHLEYGQSVCIGPVRLSLHPSGHVPGSAQVRVEYKGEVWVASGDYKIENDGLCTGFESVPCHSFISECTFGLPVFNWLPQKMIFDEIENWWIENARRRKVSILYAYSLGKAQRIIHNLKDKGILAAHETILKTNKALNKDGYHLPDIASPNQLSKEELSRSLVITPSFSKTPDWLDKSIDYSTGNCSGWMAIRDLRIRGNADFGFVLSDHADWKGLLEAVEACGARKVIVNHGYTAPFARYLREKGIEAIEAPKIS